jgi:hypothetical protein
MKRFLVVAGAGFILGLIASSCGTPVSKPSCSASSCEGCCDSNDVCRKGDQEVACGWAGVACNVCSGGQVCVATVCTFPIVDAGELDAGTDAGTDAGMDAGVDAGAPLCGSTTVTCSDQVSMNLDLKTTVNPSAILNATEDGGFKSTIDSSAGGLTPTQSFVYAKFTRAGLIKVAISDEAALLSLDWDIAFRRFVIRLNGGSSGPSCVGAAAIGLGTSYESITAPPSGANYRLDDFEGPPPMCMFKDDGSGLGTTPSTAIANTVDSYYLYSGCVRMTNQSFVVRTRYGRNVKLRVTSYYSTEAAQANCDNNGAPGTGGTVRVRWAYLD